MTPTAPQQQLLALLDGMRLWKRDGQRAPNKPLLLLLALAQVKRGEQRLISFAELEGPLLVLLDAFGPSRQVHTAADPFWRLVTDGLWDIPQRAVDACTKPPTKAELRAMEGGFPEALYQAMREDPSLVDVAASRILDEHFTPGLEEALLDAVGLELGVIDEEAGERVVRWVTSRRRARDLGFRHEVLTAYEHRCAVCGLDARMGQGRGVARSVLLEAAHVRWHSHGGADAVDNALALCLLHHGALDAGVLGLDVEQRVVVSPRLSGGQAVDAVLGDYAGRLVAGPGIAEVNRAWHEGQVFKE